MTEQNNILASIQQQIRVPKNQYNKFGGYSYRSCEDILAALKPLLSKYNSTIIINDEIALIGDRYYLKATAELKAPEEVYSATGYAREPESKKGMDESQITGAASSYARKYALNGLLGIDDVKDADTTNISANKQTNKTPKTVNKKSTKQSKTTQTNNYKFLQTIKPYKERVGEENYYNLLKEFEAEHANQLTTRNQQIGFYEVLQKAANKRFVEEATALLKTLEADKQDSMMFKIDQEFSQEDAEGEVEPLKWDSVLDINKQDAIINLIKKETSND